ncbi:phenylacetate--CoA ligase family protein [Fulvivirgaceae bacterium BMA10]|uniref:Phenylacetate--CoA ligase family protein n=1 Tax=Splendidivirga corallicola TaxID=3051826 RepID=A0ABT8KZ22_9BACT|nr:phenylacetate--CoA ligase family protein [Fulvivirgaceae bacterium BMA10]
MKLFESTLKFQGYPIDEAEQVLSEISSKDPKALYTWQEEKKWEIFQHHLKNNPAYRQIVGNKVYDKWEEVPIMQKSDLQKPIEELLSEGYNRKNIYLSNTSGSSGHPFFFAKDKFSHALSWALIKQRFGLYDVDLNSLQARFYGIPLDGKGFIQEKVKDWLSNRIRFTVFDLSNYVLKRFLNIFKKKPIEYIYGYTSSVVYFARFLLERGIVMKEICPTLKVCIITSEVCTKEDKEVISKAFGVRAVVEYGASELSVMAFEYPDGNMVCSDEITFFENYQEPNGSTSLLCTSLFNKAFPIVRYKIGDSVDFDIKNGRKVITNINGRVNDFIKLPSGKIAAGLTFYYVFRNILESSGRLKEFIIRQVKLDYFVFEIVSSGKLTKKEEKEMHQIMETYLEPDLKLDIKYVDQIDRSSSGKLKHFYSEL